MARNLNKIKKIGLLTSLLILATVIVGGTFAYLYDSTVDQPVTNEFKPANVPIEVEETIVNEVKTDVKIKNTGNIPAYIRAKIVVSWATEAGEILGTKPVLGTDYTISIDDTAWKKISDGNGDFYYYHKTPVDPEGGLTSVLINTCEAKTSSKTDDNDNTYYLRVDILAQSVQSEPANAMQELWGVSPSELKN